MLALAAMVAAFTVAGVAPATDRRITVWPHGPGEEGVGVWRVRCDPAGVTLPRRTVACRALAALERPFAPVPKDVACTQVYGGAQEARVTGTYRGRRIWARFKRTDGCEISRWNRHRFLFPGATG